MVSFPTFDEAIEQGPAIDKLAATAAKSYREKWLTSILKDKSQLPDLNDDLMAFVVREIDEDNGKYIVVSYMGKDIWRELVLYEYYEQFINLGKKFKEKYGDKMIDFVPDVGDYYIYGDHYESIGLVKNFRKEIKNHFDYTISNLEKEINLLKDANNELSEMNIEMQKFFDKLAIPIIKRTVRNVEKQLRRFPIEANQFGDDSKLNFFEEVCVMLKEGSIDDYGLVEDTIESCCLDAYNELKDNENFIVHHQTNSDHQYLPEIIKDDFFTMPLTMKIEK